MTDITFGVCVSPNFTENFLDNLVWSIVDQRWDNRVDNFEIILVGGSPKIWRYKQEDSLVRIIDFDETIKPAWITKKKNVIGHAAKYNNICLLHDYYELESGWLRGFKSIPDNWNILLNKVHTYEGYRHSDWLVHPDRMQEWIDNVPGVNERLMKLAPHENGPKFISGLPYSTRDLTHVQYISGGYVILKKEILEKVPMNEDLTWGQGEDIEWSNRLAKSGYLYNFNDDMHVICQKPGKWKLTIMTQDLVEDLRKYYGSRPV